MVRRLAHRRSLPVARGGRGERGAVLVLVAVAMSVLVSATALTVDLGRLMVERRDLQVAADATALDLARRLDGRTAGELLADPDWERSWQASMARNGVPLGADTVVEIAVGRWDRGARTFSAASGAEVPTAVRVSVQRRVDHAFAPGSGQVRRSAVASGTASAGFAVGSFAVGLDAERSALLSAVLGATGLVDGVALRAIGWEGLVGGEVALAALLERLDLDVGTPDEVLDAVVTTADLVAASASVLRDRGDLVRAELLEDVLVGLPVPGAPVRLGDLLHLEAGGEAAAAQAALDAFDLVAASVLVANGDRAIVVPAGALTLPSGLGGVTVEATVVEQPRWTFGPVGSTASTAQVRIEVRGELVAPSVASSTLAVGVEVASGSATSTRVSCRIPVELDLAVDSGLVTARTDVAARVRALGIPVADVALRASTSGQPAPRSVGFVVPPDRFGVFSPAPPRSLDLGSTSIVVDRVDVIGLPLGGIVGPAVALLVDDVVGPVLDGLELQVVGPLLEALGVEVAGADVAPLSVACSRPRVVD